MKDLKDYITKIQMPHLQESNKQSTCFFSGCWTKVLEKQSSTAHRSLALGALWCPGGLIALQRANLIQKYNKQMANSTVSRSNEGIKMNQSLPDGSCFDRCLTQVFVLPKQCLFLFLCTGSPYPFMSIYTIIVLTIHKTITTIKLSLILSPCGYINYLFTLWVHENFIGTI